jgi:predicted transcriptional regulator
MAMNARLSPELEALLNEYCERTGNARSQVMRDALKSHLSAKERRTRPTFYGLAKDLIPEQGLPQRQSRDVKRIMSEHWRGKRAA